MEPFVVTKENLGRVIPSVVAENSDYKVRIMYDGNYKEDARRKSVDPKKMLIGAKPKKAGLYKVEYQAYNAKAFVVLPSNEVCTDSIPETVLALQSAEAVAVHIRELLKKYL